MPENVLELSANEIQMPSEARFVSDLIIYLSKVRIKSKIKYKLISKDIGNERRIRE